MKKLQDKMRKLRKNNKGFTLVELIIVIAIIAILATVFAPMYTKYVEDARETNDIRTAEALMQATVTSIIDPEFAFTGTSSDTMPTEITVTMTNGVVTYSPATTNVESLVETILPDAEIKVESTAGKGTLTFTVNTSTGVVTVTTAKGTGDVKTWGDLVDGPAPTPDPGP